MGIGRRFIFGAIVALVLGAGRDVRAGIAYAIDSVPTIGDSTEINIAARATEEPGGVLAYSLRDDVTTHDFELPTGENSDSGLAFAGGGMYDLSSLTSDPADWRPLLFSDITNQEQMAGARLFIAQQRRIVTTVTTAAIPVPLPAPVWSGLTLLAGVAMGINVRAKSMK